MPKETTKTDEGNMSSVERLKVLVKTNFKCVSFMLDLSYLQTQAVVESVQ